MIWFQVRQDVSAIDPIFHARIAEALQNVRSKDTVFARLQVARAMSKMLTASTSERISWIEEALSLTRETEDLRARLDVICGAQRSHTRLTDSTNELDLAEEMLQLAVALRSPECELEARQWKANGALELGRGSDYEIEVAACRERAAVIGTPQATWVAGALHVGQLFLAGSLVESERLAREIGGLGQQLMGVGGLLYMLTQLLQVSLESDVAEAHPILGEVVEGLERILALAPNLQALIPVVARAKLYCGRADAAREYLVRVTSRDYVAPDQLDRNLSP